MENNKLIAEFMGKEHYPKFHHSNYHKSWDWLMPVVETCFHNGADENHIGDLTHALLDCNLEYTYKAVVEFIKEYNKKPKER